MNAQSISCRVAREIRGARLAFQDRTYAWPVMLDDLLGVSRFGDVSRHAARRRGQTVDFERLLCGDQRGVRADVFAAHLGEPMWPSTRLVDSPFVALYRAFADTGDRDLHVDGEAAYLAFAARSIAAVGTHHGCRTADDVRRLIGELRDDFSAHGPATELPALEHPRPLVRPIRNSGYFQIVAGHHRLAAQLAAGRSSAEVDVTWIPAVTPVQRQLRNLAWMRGTTELYQPIDAPELSETWTLGRRCEDRLEMMTSHLDRLDLTGGTYLDVGSSYGWFVAKMGERGFAAQGVEIDGGCAVLGEMAYGVPRSAITVGDALQLLRFTDRTWDVVSCFSVVHQVIRAQGRDAGVALIRELDRVTGSALYFDMGQRDEGWDRAGDIGWTPDEIEAVFRAETRFTNVERLGTDHDSSTDYRSGVGRTLFAFTR